MRLTSTKVGPIILDRVKIGIVSRGDIAFGSDSPAIRELADRAETVVVCDSDKAPAERAKEKYRVQCAFADGEELPGRTRWCRGLDSLGPDPKVAKAITETPATTAMPWRRITSNSTSGLGKTLAMPDGRRSRMIQELGLCQRIVRKGIP